MGRGGGGSGTASGVGGVVMYLLVELICLLVELMCLLVELMCLLVELICLLERCNMFVIGYKRHHIITTRFGIHYHNKHITHN